MNTDTIECRFNPGTPDEIAEAIRMCGKLAFWARSHNVTRVRLKLIRSGWEDLKTHECSPHAYLITSLGRGSSLPANHCLTFFSNDWFIRPITPKASPEATQ